MEARQGRCALRREFPWKEREAQLGDCPPPHSPAVAFPFSGMRGTFSGLSTFDGDAFGSAGIPVGGGGEPWASLWCLPSTRGDLSSLPSPPIPFPGKPAGSFLSSDSPLSFQRLRRKSSSWKPHPPFASASLNSVGELRLQGTSPGNPWQLAARNSAHPGEAGRDWPPKTTPLSWARPGAGAWEFN